MTAFCRCREACPASKVSAEYLTVPPCLQGITEVYKGMVPADALEIAAQELWPCGIRVLQAFKATRLADWKVAKQLLQSAMEQVSAQ